MTKEMVKAYCLLSPAKRLGLILACILLVATGSVVVATAADTVTFSGQIPVNGSAVPAARPVIGLTVTVAAGTIDESNLQMAVDNTTVTPTVYSETPGTYKVNFIPASDLSEGNHTVVVGVYDDTEGTAQTANWSFNVDRTPKITALTPADGANTDSSKISLTVKDTFDDLVESSAILKIDGVAVPAGFKFEGYDYYDSCGGYQEYIITSYKSATVEYQPIKDGPHSAEFSIADVNGNIMTRHWSFTVAAKPAFSSFNPYNNMNARTLSAISVQVSDNDIINPNSIMLKVNNNAVNHSFDPTTGIISYNSVFADGTYSAEVTAADMAGHITTAAWSFTVGNIAPNIAIVPYKPYTNYTGPAYLFQDGMTVTDGMLYFHALITDSYDEITPNTALKLDGQVLPASIRYDGRTVEQEIGEDEEGNPIYSYTYVITSKKRVYVDYYQPVGDGTHTLTLTARDVLGKEVTKQWSFTGATKPTFSEWKPAAYITDFTPTVSVKVKDNDNIDTSRISMTLSGQTVTPSYDSSSGVISYTPSESLANESYYTIAVSVYDVFGNFADKTWKFNINTYPDMPDAGINNCTACHTSSEEISFNGPFEAIHYGKIRFGGTHGNEGFPLSGNNNDCSQCHNYIDAYPGCGQCHGNRFTSSTTKHGDTPAISYNLTKPDATLPVRVSQNREMWDCVICHQPGSGIQKHESPGSTALAPQNNHDIPELHKAPASSCNECHARSLTREHARPGRLDQNGLPINCNTCHLNTDTNIKNAVSNNDKSCSACHQQTNHDEIHTGGADTGCQTSGCHGAALSGDHTTRNDANGNNYTCDTCHTSTGKAAKRTIAAKSLNCGGCHNQLKTHNVVLADKVPSDIPLYTGFQWSAPVESSIFTGDANAPEGYGSGQVVISNRRTAVTTDQIRNFYNEQLTGKGWTLMFETPAGAGSTTAEFVYGSRSVTVKAFNTEHSDGTGSQVGCRIELWYK